MNVPTKLYLCAAMACCGMISARSAVPERFADSVRMDEVIVTGSRPAVNFRNLPMSVSVVEERQIERRFEPSLLPVLTEQEFLAMLQDAPAEPETT